MKTGRPYFEELDLHSLNKFYSKAYMVWYITSTVLSLSRDYNCGQY